MKFEILLSCMHQNDLDLMQEANIKCPVLFINQADREDYQELDNARMITLRDRGLSKSRNLALQEARGDICLIADEDEWFVDDLEEKIVNAYDRYPDADIIAFKLIDYHKGLGEKERVLSKWETLKVSSCQISFKRSSIQGKFSFDEKLGAGSPNGAGEENKFLWDCVKKGLKIVYVPYGIAKVKEGQSSWFFGYDTRYFFNRGKTTRYTYGLGFSFIYALYFLFKKQGIYKKELSMRLAFKAYMKGIFAKNIDSPF